MTFARTVFRIAGVWGLLVLAPFYFMAERFGVAATPPGAQFYYGFLAVTIAWQIAFLIIATDPVRFRPLIPAAILEKFGYVISLIALYAQSRIGWNELSTAVPDAILGAIFIAAFIRTRA